MNNSFSEEFNNLSPDKRTKIEVVWTRGFPAKIISLGTELGLNIFESQELPEDVSGEIRPGESPSGFEITVAAFDPRVRKRFTIAHEIAHFLLHRSQIGRGIQDDALYRSSQSNRIEAQANRLAADILMPMTYLQQEHDKIRDYQFSDKLEVLSSTFGVSGTAMGIRLSGIGVFETTD